MLLAAGVTAWIVGQAVINLGAVVGAAAGLRVSPLPFLSVGGSSLVITMFGAGILANIARQAPAAATQPTPSERPTVADRAVSRRVNGERTGLRAAHGRRHRRAHLSGDRRCAGLGRSRQSVRFVGGRRGIAGPGAAAAGFDIDLLRARAAAPAHARQRERALRRGLGVRARPCDRAPPPPASGGRLRRLRVAAVCGRRAAAAGASRRARTGCRARSRQSHRCAARRAPAVSLPGTPLPGATLTGNPVRETIAAIERMPEIRRSSPCTAARKARTINRAALGCYDRWRARRDLAVHHVCGPRNLEECRADLEAHRRRRRRCATTSSVTKSTWTRCTRARRWRCAAPAPERSPSSRSPACPRCWSLAGRPERSSGAQRADARTGGRGRARQRRRMRSRPARRARRAAPQPTRTPSRDGQQGVRARAADAAARVADLVEEHACRVPDDLDLSRPRRLHIVGSVGSA